MSSLKIKFFYAQLHKLNKSKEQQNLNAGFTTFGTMEALKKILNFYVQSSIHVALSVVCLTVLGLEMNDRPLNLVDLLLLFTATVSGYNFVKYAGIARLHHMSLTRNLRLIQIFSFFCAVGLIYSLFQQSTDQLILLVGLAGVNFLYAIPFLPQKKNLRSLRGVKIFVIALIWAFAIVVYPIIHLSNFEMDFHLILRLIRVFAFVLALTLPFEIRDLKSDLAELGTIPQYIGIRKTKQLAYALMLLFLGISFFFHPSIILNLPELLIFGLTCWGIYHTTPQKSFYYTAFLIEGIPIVWFVLEELISLKIL